MNQFSLQNCLQQVFNVIPAAIAVVSKDGIYQMVEGNAIKAMNLKPSDFIGKNIFEFRKNSPRVLENVKRALNGETFCSEIFVNDVWFETWHFPYRENGEIMGMVAYSVDITKRKKEENTIKAAREAAEARCEAKTNFLSHASHEIRNPMTSILGFTEILRKAKLDDETRSAYLEKIDRGGHALLRLIDDLLDISRIESGKATVDKKRVKLTDWITEIISFLEVTAKRKGLDLHLKLEGRQPHTIYTDMDRVRQILTNLVNNAVKFTDKGSITVIIRCLTGKTTADDVLEFEVEDSGPGMNKEQQANLFKPFSQADSSIRSKYGGTGLGLVISKQWAERLGGSLELVYSEPGKGSNFLARVKAGPFD